MGKLTQIELDGFKLFLLRNGRTEETSTNRTYIVRKIIQDIPHLTVQSVNDYLGGLKARGLRNSSINQYIGVIRWWAQFKNIPELKQLKFLYREGVLKQTLSDDEIERFLALQPDPNCKSYPKNYRMYTLFFKICAFTGMRPGEVSNLQRDDILLGKNQILVRKAKTPSSVRIVPIPPNIIDDLKDHLKRLRRPMLFLNRNGGKIKHMNWAGVFDSRAIRIGIKRPGLTTYSLRHSLITSLIEEDVSLFKIRQLVGHKNIESTEAYVHLSTKGIARALEKHPIIRRQMDPQRILEALLEIIQAFDFTGDSRFDYKLNIRRDTLHLELKIKQPA